MLIAAHSIPAGYIGELIGNPLLAFLVGIVIHILLDMIPHYDTTDGSKFTVRQWALMVIDALIGILVIIFIIKPPLDVHSSFLWGAFGGIFPDIFDSAPGIREIFWKTRFGKAFHKFAKKSHGKHLTFIPGILIQVIIVIIFTYLYIHK